LSRNSGASTSWNPNGLSRPVVGKLFLYVAHMKKRNAYRGLLWRPKGKGHLEERGVGGGIHSFIP
jgi:hypothetical protein